MWVIRYSTKVNTPVFLQCILYAKEAFLCGHPRASPAVAVRPPGLGPNRPRRGQCRMLCFTPYAHSTVRRGFLTFCILSAQSPGSGTGPHGFCCVKGWHQLTASCLRLLPPRAQPEALSAAAQGDTCTDACTSFVQEQAPTFSAFIILQN